MRSMRLALAVACVVGCPPIMAAAAVIDEASFLSRLDATSPGSGSLAEPTSPAPDPGGGLQLLPNPVAGYEREETAGGSALTTWSVGWTLPWPSRQGAQVRAARSEVAAIGADGRADALAQRGELRAVYAQWALGVERLRVAGELRDRFTELVRTMSARARAGEESGLAERRLRLARVEIEAAVVRIEAAALASRAGARAWAPALREEDVPSSPPLPLPPASLTVDSRPDLAALEARLAQAEAAASAAGVVVEAPALEFGWRSLSEDGERRGDGTRARVEWPLPLFQRNAPDRAVAQQNLRTSRSRFLRAQGRAAAELAAAQAEYTRLREAALALAAPGDDGVRAIAAATAAYQANETTLTDLLDTYRSAFAGELAALDLYADALAAHRALEIAAGRPLSPEEVK